MRDDPQLLEPKRRVTNVEQKHAVGASLHQLHFKIWDNVAEFVPEVLGEEDCYRLGWLDEHFNFGLATGDTGKGKARPVSASVVDLGANVGTFTIAMLLRGAEVMAVEGDWSSLQLLLHNVQQNIAREFRRVHPIQACVAGASPLQRFYWKGPKSLTPPIEVTSQLWDYFEQSKGPRIIKIDIEESEKALFKDPTVMGFFAMAQIVLMEWHCYDGHVYAQGLESLGFSVELTGCGNPAPGYEPSFARGMLYARK